MGGKGPLKHPVARPLPKFVYQSFNVLSTLQVCDPVNEGLSFDVFELGRQTNYILVEVLSGASLAKMLSMSSDSISQFNFCSQRTKQILVVQSNAIELR